MVGVEARQQRLLILLPFPEFLCRGGVDVTDF